MSYKYIIKSILKSMSRNADLDIFDRIKHSILNNYARNNLQKVNDSGLRYSDYVIMKQREWARS